MDAFNRRKQYFIDKRMQGIWGLLNLLIAGLIALLIGFEFLRSSLIEFGWPLAGKAFNLPDMFFLVKIVILAAIGGGFFWLLSSFAGHRIAGPIYKLDESLKQVRNGNFGLRIQFRKKDFFQHIAKTFNEMNEHIEQKFKEKEELIERVKEEARGIPLDNPHAQELKRILGI